MPTYEYKCEKCGHIFEYYQSMDDKPLHTCPKCRGKVTRLFGTGIVLPSKDRNCSSTGGT